MKKLTIAIACIVIIAVMTIWMWGAMTSDFSEPWIDRYDRSYGR